MSQIYVPIDYTGLAEVIPPGDDILYSTLCRGKIEGVAAKAKRKHKAHVLITTTGFAVTKSLLKSNPEFTFYSWTDGKYWKKIRSFRRKLVKCFYRTAGFIMYKPICDTQFEDRESFNKRRLVFGEFCKDLYLKANGLN